MQTTQPIHNDENSIETIWLILGIAAAVLLCLLALGRFGIFNSLMTGGVEVTAGEQLMTTQNMKFGTETLRLEEGDTVTIRLDNQDLYPHSFDIDELDIHVQMPANGIATAEFTPDKPGTYQFYCAIPGHQEAGMVGTLIVE